MSATAQPLRLATYERAGRWAAAVGVPGERLVDAEAAARRAGLDDGVAWSSVRAIVARSTSISSWPGRRVMQSTSSIRSSTSSA